MILLLSLALRLYRFNDLSSFGFDQARDAGIERQMILTGKPTLLGPQTLIGDKTIYFGPWHYYLMAPALWLAHFDPVGPDLWTVVLGVATTAVIFAISGSALAALFYAVFPLAVIYNRFAWNPNTVPLFCALALLFFSRKRDFLAGLFFGLAVQLHPTALLLVLFFLRRFRWPIILGALVGLSPIIVFDFRHQFLYLHGYLSLFSANWAYRGFNWHYFLWLLPGLSLWVGSLKPKLAAIIIFLAFAGTVFYLASQPAVFATSPATIKKVSSLIVSDQDNSALPFDVASFSDADTRATAYRYFLDLAGLTPLGVGEYSVADHIYVTSFAGPENVLYNKTYEVASFSPKKIIRIGQEGNLFLYRLEK